MDGGPLESAQVVTRFDPRAQSLGLLAKFLIARSNRRRFFSRFEGPFADRLIVASQSVELVIPHTLMLNARGWAFKLKR